jgi:hypothetical protein
MYKYCDVIYVNDVSERSCVLCDICERRKWMILHVMWYMWATQVSDLVCYVIYVNHASERFCVLCDICERRKWAILCVMWYMWTTEVNDLACYVIYVSDASEWSCVLCDICDARKWAILLTHKITHLRRSQISHNTQDHSLASLTYIT